MDLLISARSAAEDGADYRPAEAFGLRSAVEWLPLDGRSITPLRARATIANQGPAPWSGVLRVELPFPSSSPRFFLPGFIYGRNRGEAPLRTRREWPRIREGACERPASPWWMTRSDRLTHPVALAFDGGRVYGLGASPYYLLRGGRKLPWLPSETGEFYQYCGFSCDIARGTLGYTLGYEEAPLSFIQSTRVLEGGSIEGRCFELGPGESVDAMLDVFDYPAEGEQGVSEAIRHTYYKYHQPPRAAASPRDALADISGAVDDYAWLPGDNAYAGQVFEDGSGGYRYNKIFSISWTNGLAAAVPLLMAALRTGRAGMRARALAVIGDIVDHSLNPRSGLPYDALSDGKWRVDGWWYDGLPVGGHSGYLVGQAAYYILKAYELELTLAGEEHREWMDFASQVIEAAERARNGDGEYPYVFSEATGSGLEYDSMGSAWCLAASAYRSWLAGRGSVSPGQAASEERYYSAYVKRMECYGGPLDTDKAVDSEGIVAYVKALRYLHALSGSPAYLERMREALNYEFSFKFCYDSPVKYPPLSDIGWSSCGGTITSTANPHIHPMGNVLVDEMLYYLRRVDDGYVRDRLADTVGWGCQSYNTRDGEFGYGKKGWMSERFCYSEGLLTERFADGRPASTWFCLMPWAAGCVVEGLAGDYWDAGSEAARA